MCSGQLQRAIIVQWITAVCIWQLQCVVGMTSAASSSSSKGDSSAKGRGVECRQTSP